MKKLMLLAMLFIATTCSAQVNFNEKSLDSLNKMALTDLYLKEITKLVVLAPYIPFSYEVVDSAGKIDMPSNKYNVRNYVAAQEMGAQYGEVIRYRLYELIPYADKSNIIKGILYLHSINANFKQLY